MPLNDGEREALLRQVAVHVSVLERKMVQLGLSTAGVGLYDVVTRTPLNRPEQIIAMAEGYCMNCLAGPRTPAGTPHSEGCEYNPKEKEKL